MASQIVEGLAEAQATIPALRLALGGTELEAYTLAARATDAARMTSARGGHWPPARVRRDTSAGRELRGIAYRMGLNA